jgi:histidine ammonia-lyase
MAEPFPLRPGALTLADLRRLDEASPPVELDPSSAAGIEAAHVAVAGAIAEKRRIYGVNTGFGSLSDTVIPEDQMRELQRRLVLSNAVGSGQLLDDRVVRRILILKVNALACGRSGVRRELVDGLLALLNTGVMPCVPAKGSVGASGDISPLAHVAVALMGVGDVRLGGEVMAASDGLAKAGLAPLELAPKEGLSMVNGTQVSTALAIEGLFALEDVFAAAMVAGALSLEAALGAEGPFDARLHQARGQPGEIAVAAAFRDLLEGSGMREAARQTGRVQDPYSLRCQPQVMGAVLDHLGFAAEVLAREANAVSDNPLVWAEDGDILYGGNFHAAPVGLAADMLALAINEVGGLAERRLALLTDANFSGLPPFLVAESGLNSGFMAAQIAAAALASENKALAHPGSADSIPTVANFEDYVSMATYAARRLGEMAENAASIIAAELLAAAQGVDLRRPLRSSAPLEEAHALIRAHVAAYTKDRFMAPEIAEIAALVRAGAFRGYVAADLLPSGA